MKIFTGREARDLILTGTLLPGSVIKGFVVLISNFSLMG
jgi:hypothetical protein